MVKSEESPQDVASSLSRTNKILACRHWTVLTNHSRCQSVLTNQSSININNTASLLLRITLNKCQQLLTTTPVSGKLNSTFFSELDIKASQILLDYYGLRVVDMSYFNIKLSPGCPKHYKRKILFPKTAKIDTSLNIKVPC